MKKKTSLDPSFRGTKLSTSHQNVQFARPSLEASPTLLATEFESVDADKIDRIVAAVVVWAGAGVALILAAIKFVF